VYSITPAPSQKCFNAESQFGNSLSMQITVNSKIVTESSKLHIFFSKVPAENSKELNLKSGAAAENSEQHYLDSKGFEINTKPFKSISKFFI